MSDFLVAIGLVLAIEGSLYALMPQSMRDMMRKMMDTPPDTLRMGGVVAVAVGVGIVWLVRGA
ncbi:MAG: DUF2065 family protein [Pseudomonadota bacterium]